MRAPQILSLAVAAFLSLNTAVEAQTYVTRERARVTQVAPNVFEVVPRDVGSGGEVYWCAASRYVANHLGLSWQTKITISRVRGPSQVSRRNDAVHFTTDPAALGIERRSTFWLNQITVGDTQTAQQASGRCFAVSRRPN